ncbi:hypothetical protein OHC33_011269 [Knufia fluminis]|uniref:Uncharacterized protein n=1 Tax=Knufia fluminis TaxID=191047 RepID=A0AAN8EEG7_9EURO|nr:hypothetical protein OHC33_011269 [Knufia fluminis]
MVLETTPELLREQAKIWLNTSRAQNKSEITFPTRNFIEDSVFDLLTEGRNFDPTYFTQRVFLGSAFMFTIRAYTSVAKVYGYEVLIAAGAGLTFQNAYAVTASKARKDDTSNAIGCINTSQIGTTALALAIASCLYQNLGVELLR